MEKVAPDWADDDDGDIKHRAMSLLAVTVRAQHRQQSECTRAGS